MICDIINSRGKGVRYKMLTERQALREYINYLREERLKISDEYWKAVTRLRELDERQQYYYNESKSLDCEVKIDKLIHQVELLNKKLIEQNKLPYQEQYEEHTEVKITSKRRYNKSNVISGIIIDYLKENRDPVKARDINLYLQHRGY